MTNANLRFVALGKYRNVGPFFVSYGDDTELCQTIIKAAFKHGSLKDTEVPDRVLTVRLQKWADGQLPTFAITNGHRERIGWGTLERLMLP